MINISAMTIKKTTHTRKRGNKDLVMNSVGYYFLTQPDTKHSDFTFKFIFRRINILSYRKHFVAILFVTTTINTELILLDHVYLNNQIKLRFMFYINYIPPSRRDELTCIQIDPSEGKC